MFRAGPGCVVSRRQCTGRRKWTKVNLPDPAAKLEALDGGVAEVEADIDARVGVLPAASEKLRNERVTPGCVVLVVLNVTRSPKNRASTSANAPPCPLWPEG